MIEALIKYVKEGDTLIHVFTCEMYKVKQAFPSINQYTLEHINSGKEHKVNSNELKTYYDKIDSEDTPVEDKKGKKNESSKDGNSKNERVEHPSHYTWLKELCGIEVIDIARHMDFDLGNALKYILRAGHKNEEGLTNKEKMIEDLEKAIFYLKDKVCILKKN